MSPQENLVSLQNCHILHAKDSTFVKTINYQGAFQVRTRTDIKQYISVSGLTDGTILIIKQDLSSSSSDNEIYAQRYNPTNCSEIGQAFLVNTYTQDRQIKPVATGLKNGGFVVVWQSFNQDGSNFGIYAQRYSSIGMNIGSEFQVNTYAVHDQFNPSVSYLNNFEGSGYIVVWQSFFQNTSNSRIHAQIYNDADVKVGDEFQVNANKADKYYPAVLGLSDGGFVVTWQQLNEFGTHSIYAQRYDAKGTTASSEFLVNNHEIGDMLLPQILEFEDCRFMIIWQYLGGSSFEDAIYAQQYDLECTKIGHEFPIDTSKLQNKQEFVSNFSLGNEEDLTWIGSFQYGGRALSLYGNYGNLLIAGILQPQLEPINLE